MFYKVGFFVACSLVCLVIGIALSIVDTGGGILLALVSVESKPSKLPWLFFSLSAVFMGVALWVAFT